jgi:putative flippase GtrA
MITGMYGRFRHLIHEGGKFLVVGGIGTVVTFVVANGLNSIGKYKAVTIATIVATVVTYLGNRYWTFKHRESKGTTRDTVMFFLLNAVGLLIYYGCIALIQDVAGLKSRLWYNIALFVGTGLGTLFRFWSYRRWVWTLPGTSDGMATSTLGELAEPHPHHHGTDEPLPEHETLSPQQTANSRPVGAHRRT